MIRISFKIPLNNQTTLTGSLASTESKLRQLLNSPKPRQITDQEMRARAKARRRARIVRRRKRRVMKTIKLPLTRKKLLK